MTEKRLLLDANILVRALFGKRVKDILLNHSETIEFYCPDICFAEARKYIPSISVRTGQEPAAGFQLLDRLAEIIEPVDRSFYEEYEATPAVASPPATSRTGRSSQPPCCSTALSGRKTRTSLGAASPPGQRTTSKFFFRLVAPDSFRRTLSLHGERDANPDLRVPRNSLPAGLRVH
jgi:hypothetical protein